MKKEIKLNYIFTKGIKLIDLLEKNYVDVLREKRINLIYSNDL